MKHYFILLLSVVFAMCLKVQAQTTDSLTDASLADSLIINQMPNVRVYQDSLITKLMIRKRFDITQGAIQKDGFRLQVYASNQPSEAKNEALVLQQRLESELDVDVYVLSEPPFWKVRIGNFNTRDDANQYKTQILTLFPDLQSSTYVVPDQIDVAQ